MYGPDTHTIVNPRDMKKALSMCVVPLAAVGGGGAARGARLPHGGAGGLPGRALRRDARRLARRPGAAAQLRRHAAPPGRHARRRAPAPVAPAPGNTTLLYYSNMIPNNNLGQFAL